MLICLYAVLLKAILLHVHTSKNIHFFCPGVLYTEIMKLISYYKNFMNIYTCLPKKITMSGLKTLKLLFSCNSLL